MTPGLRERTSGVMYGHTLTLLAIHHIRHQAIRKMGCQPGDCRWPLESSSRVCVGIYVNTETRNIAERDYDIPKSFDLLENLTWDHLGQTCESLRLCLAWMKAHSSMLKRFCV